MSELSPALQRVCTAAITHFADHGYDGASLSTIASMVGIRKATLYSHVEGKDALFLLCLREAIAVEQAFASLTLSGAAGPKGPGSGYVEVLGERFETSSDLRMLLRAAFFPPAHHRSAIAEQFERLNRVVRQCYVAQFHQAHGDRLAADQVARYADAYLGIIDSLCVELQYASRAQMQVRYAALWSLLEDSVQLRTTGLAAPAHQGIL